ncbi:MAG: hypothetical protein PHG18_04640, partial [Bacilli bacterium]|nr:hypothetical protein [Bacilli bacterium]
SHTHIIPEYILFSLIATTAGLQAITASLYYKTYKEIEDKKRIHENNITNNTEDINDSNEKKRELEKKTDFSNQEEIDFLKSFKASTLKQAEQANIENEKTKKIGLYPKKGDK